MPPELLVCVRYICVRFYFSDINHVIAVFVLCYFMYLFLSSFFFIYSGVEKLRLSMSVLSFPLITKGCCQLVRTLVLQILSIKTKAWWYLIKRKVSPASCPLFWRLAQQQPCCPGWERVWWEKSFTWGK